jgi:hypothetical protein
MALPNFRWECTGNVVARNERGDVMRRVTLVPVPSEAFQSPEDVTRVEQIAAARERAARGEKEPKDAPNLIHPAGQNGLMEFTVSAEYAKRYEVGKQYDFPAREVE